VIPIDALFNTAFGELDQVDAELRQMAELGFNTVRVWKNACWGGVGGCVGDPAGGLSAGYLNNIAEFLHMARRHGIYVLFTDDWIPRRRRVRPHPGPGLLRGLGARIPADGRVPWAEDHGDSSRLPFACSGSGSE
jgi:hypothetical protein